MTPAARRRATRARAGGPPLAAALALLAAGGAAVAPAAELTFTEVAAEAGLTFRHAPLGDTPGWPMHGGGTVGDFDGDGWPDLFFPGGGAEPDALFVNRRDGTFADEAAAWGLGDLYRGVGASAADFDGDGHVDLYVTSFGDRPEIRNGQHRLYRNTGDGRFVEVAAAAGVSSTGPEVIPDGYGSTWGDYDLDGDLDLWVAGWGSDSLPPVATSRLFRNRGDGTFADVTVAAGVEDRELRAFGAAFADMDGDGHPELLVAGDFGTSRYLANRGDGTFVSVAPGVPRRDRVHNGMGLAVGDFDRDGRPDWLVTAIFPAWQNEGPPGNRLYLNRSAGAGDHQLRTLPGSAGVIRGGWGWGAAAVDLDHDGWLDAVHTNGWISGCGPEPPCYQADTTRLFRNLGDGTFADVAAEAGLLHDGQGRALLDLDHDRDGDVDLVIVDNAGRVHLFRNDLAGPDAHWLEVRLDTGGAPGLAPDGVGSRIDLVGGGVHQARFVDTASNYLGHGELVAHFGLGAATVVEAVVVTWPDGSRTVRREVAADRLLVVVPDR